MENKEIIKQLGLIASLMELHGENPFKVRGYSSAVYHLEKADIALAGKTLSELEEIEGVGKRIAQVIYDINESGSSQVLEDLLKKTPEGLIPLLEINGFGPKKISQIWKELGITNGDALYQACISGEISSVKGFGDKLQEKLKKALQFSFENRGKFRYRQTEKIISKFESELKQQFPEALIFVAGDFRRRLEIIDKAVFVIGTKDIIKVDNELNKMDMVDKNLLTSGPFSWRGSFKEVELSVEIHLTSKQNFFNQLIKFTGSDKHLFMVVSEDKNIYQLLSEQSFESEEAFYQSIQMQFIPPELREGDFEFDLAKEHKIPKLITDNDLKGILHNHTTFSDGQHTLKEMANYCQSLGYEYLGICDHSKTAVYANGLDEDRVRQQQEEIDALNKEMAPFRIFKGIESDILNDGQLDYDDKVLSSFDFIVASIHSQLSMDIDKATSRLLTAIANPFTTMLGHPTGRLLLKRAGYPINHKAVIDACANHDVIIEINAHPFRLDLDWRWVNYAINQGVKISINPDAHSMQQLELMKYGVLVGRKGGLTKASTFNSLSVDEVASYFEKRKEKILAKAR